MASASVGSYNQPDVSARYGGTLAGQTTYRLYAKGYDRNNFDGPMDEDAHDSSNSLRTGFRLDNEQSSRDTFSLQGEVFDGEADAEIMLRIPLSSICTHNKTYKLFRIYSLLPEGTLRLKTSSIFKTSLWSIWEVWSLKNYKKITPIYQ